MTIRTFGFIQADLFVVMVLEDIVFVGVEKFEFGKIQTVFRSFMTKTI